MQFHLNGFRSGDPDVHPAASSQGVDGLPDEVDVLIIGCGPAGLTLAAYLSGFPDITTRIVERKSGPLEVGRLTGSPSARSKCSTHSVSPNVFCVKGIGSMKPSSGGRTRKRRNGLPGPGVSTMSRKDFPSFPT